MMNAVALPQDMESVIKQGQGTTFPPYINLLNSNSPKVKGEENEAFKAWIDQFVLIEGEKKIVHLGKNEFDAVVVGLRLKALRWGDKNKDAAFHPGTVESGGDEDLYVEIQQEADDRSLKDPGTYRSYGLEFLLWVPAVEKFATFHFGSWTGRKYAGDQTYELVKAGITNVTFSRFWIEKGNFPRFAVAAKEMEGEVSVQPDPADLERELHLFKNPPVFEQEETTNDGR